MSAGVGPSADIRVPKEADNSRASSKPKGETTQIMPPQNLRKLLGFRHLNSLAVMVVLSASGMVSIEDIAFVVFSLIYLYFLSKIAFPTIPNRPVDPPVFGEKNRILGLYVLFAALIGLLVPIAYIFEGVFEGDQEGIKAASPHLFLLASQVFMEGVSVYGGFSLPIRVFVPVFYNSRRIFTLVEWLRSEIYKTETGYSGSGRRLYVGRALAVANMALWCFNLFGFLLPFYLPKAFKIYYSPPRKAE